MMEYYYIVGAQGCVIIALIPTCWIRGRQCSWSCWNCRMPLHIEGCTYFSIDSLLVTVLSSRVLLIYWQCIVFCCNSVIVDHSIRRNRSRSWCSERSFVVVNCAENTQNTHRIQLVTHHFTQHLVPSLRYCDNEYLLILFFAVPSSRQFSRLWYLIARFHFVDSILCPW